MDASPDTVLSVATTVGAEDDARRLARAAVEQKLAACVQVERIDSHYRWEESLQADAELRLTFKTTAGRLPALRAFLAEQHPYDLPQVLWTACAASPEYAAWVRAEVGDLSG